MRIVTLVMVSLTIVACSASKVANPPQTSVASISVVLNPSAIQTGHTAQATATAKDANGATLSGRTIAWGTSSTAVAAVGPSGLVTGIAPGTATINAASEGTTGEAIVTVSASPPVPVSSVNVSPSSASLVAGDSRALTATTYDASGNPLPGRSIAWSSSKTAVATVSSTGTVAAVSAGNATITATSEGKSGTASITVTAAVPAPVSTVAVSPTNPSIQAGGTLQLTATLRDASGNTLTGRAITWTSGSTSSATVNSGGLVTAVAAGTSLITATSEGKSGSSTVTVTDVSQNACASHAGWLWCDDFEQDRTSSYFEYDNASGQFVRAAGVGRNGGFGMRAHFNAGQVSAGSLKLAIGHTPSSYFRAVDAGTANYREMYWRVYVRSAPNWTGGGGYKMSRALIISGADWSNAAFAHIWNGGPPDPGTLTAEPASGTDAAGNVVTVGYNDFAHMRWLGGVTGPTALFDAAHVGPWYCVEAHARLNDPGQSNGIFEFWINGGLEARKTGMNWVGNYTAYGWNAVFLENYWNDGSPQAQDRFFDDFVVSTQPIGCS